MFKATLKSGDSLFLCVAALGLQALGPGVSYTRPSTGHLLAVSLAKGRDTAWK